ncbi:long-chain-fatty-acid--CoA ligase [Gordonia neofelifaecis]|uniref:Fatty-acid--CoA ligase n=1 Tax=Gordonia neofelifaecis NRRL B-59395 TaxID=644548 RepID=F1YFS6_9ACTN|nr:long-chain-fatty-acid--CoA ligase [Gordonia neofelifaecis]EGD56503.1 fatty-acid--CoA ligase [Gordonia neofelifaecis NRRL B-59395]
MYLTQALHRNVQAQPDQIATICGDRTRTHNQTINRIARFAAALGALGVRPDDRVAILALNSDRYFEVLMATAWADAVMVPVNTRWSVAEIAFSLADAEAGVLVVDDAFSGMVDDLRSACPGVRSVIHAGDQASPAGLEEYEDLIARTEPVPDAHRRGDALAGIFYTGGTTGTPKGVMLSHRNLLTSALGSAAAGIWGVRGRMLHVAPMFHLADLASVVGCMLLGGSHVMLPTFDPETVCRTIGEHQVTDALLVPTMMQILVDDPHVKDYPTDCLANIMYGASPISEALLARTRAAFPSAALNQAYGMTELSPVATLLRDEDHDHPVRRRSAGQAAPHALVRVVDPDGADLPTGSVGEIVCAGDHVMLGYWNRPEETAAALRDGWMHTGDGGYLDEDGYVYVVDRIKDMIITGGENVYSVEVENAIAKHPAVAQCAVIGIPDDRWGERVHAVVGLMPGQTLTLDELADHVREHIAGYKVPRSMSVVEQFPMSGAGKILKRELRIQFASAE